MPRGPPDHGRPIYETFVACVPTSLGLDRGCWRAIQDEILGVVDSQRPSMVWGLRGGQERRFARRHPLVLADRSAAPSYPRDSGAMTFPMTLAYVEAYAAARAWAPRCPICGSLTDTRSSGSPGSASRFLDRAHRVRAGAGHSRPPAIRAVPGSRLRGPQRHN